MSNQAYPLDECVYEDDDDYDDDDVALLGSNVGIKKEFSMNQKRCLQEQRPLLPYTLQPALLAWQYAA